MTTYEDLPDKYRAYLDTTGVLVVLPVHAQIYMRYGYEGFGATKLEAVEILRKNLMKEFQDKMKRIDWQSREFGI